jgi:hypothetical protein
VQAAEKRSGLEAMEINNDNVNWKRKPEGKGNEVEEVSLLLFKHAMQQNAPSC